MSYTEICNAVQKLRNKYRENDPFELCKQMGILVLVRHFGTSPDAIKGFYLESSRIRSITINGDLPSVIQKIIISHELGHAVLHRNSGVHAFHDITMFDQTSALEKEANLFAAEFLLEDEAVLDILNRDITFFTAASQLMVPAELLDFKFRVLKWKGYTLTESPVTVRSNFLRDLEVPNDAFCYYS